MNLAFFGGTFNPPHKGHEQIIEYCYKKFNQLIIMPNSVSPHKIKNPPILEIHRLKMLDLIIGKKNIKIDTFEVDSNRINYTYYTLKYLIQKYQSFNIYMVIGEDQLANLHNWYKIDFILDNVNIICFKRDNYYIKNEMIQNIEYIPFNYSISSSKLRAMIIGNVRLNDKMMSNKVYQYIKDNNLYKES
tara:strand:+ start:592 stop:1158 length:567 start_codon:yes stop_codon:yes gene_type:complete